MSRTWSLATIVCGFFLVQESALGRSVDGLTEGQPDQVIPGLNLSLVGLDRKGDAGGASLGVQIEFDGNFSEALQEPTDQNGHVRYDLSAGLRGSGQIAFDSADNPDNFVEAKLVGGFRRLAGGQFDFDAARTKRHQQLHWQQAKFASTDDEGYQAIERELRKLIREAGGPDSDVTVVDLNLVAGLESNQEISTKQLVYGLEAQLAAAGWSGVHAEHFEELPLWGKANLLDYPFAMVRLLTKADKNFIPSSTDLPVIRAGIAQVEPPDDDPRALAGDSSAFPRFDFEVSFKTRLAAAKGQQFYAALSFRKFQEIGADDVIKAAELDSYKYFVWLIGSEAGPYISYSVGRLPLDVTEDQTYKLGYQLHLGGQ